MPFGLLVRNKPRHYREMLRVLWENRGHWLYAWRILRHGVCDGCSLGPRGLRDDVISGVHLCLTRLKFLRLNTMGPIAPERLGDIAALRALKNEELERLGRIPYPLLRRRGDPGFTRISWDEALSLVAERLGRADPDRVGMFVTSRGLTNEAYYMLQKLARVAGTPHIDSCARLCHAASTVGLKQTLGFGAGTCSLKDWIGTDLILIIGSNLANNQPVSIKYLHFAKKRGARIVVINPFREPALERYWVPSLFGSALFGTRLMDEYYPVKPAGDIALLSGVLKALDEIGGFDERFVTEQTEGAAELREHLSRLSWAEIEQESGLERQRIRELAETYKRAERAVIVYSMGLTQYTFGVDNVKMVANLALSRGNVGRPNTGVVPIRGHSGVQGTAECGVDADKLPGALDINDENCERLERAWGAPIPHRKGLRAAQLLERAGSEGLDVLYLVGGNHLHTMPDPAHARRALQRVGLRVHQDIVLNQSTLLDAEELVLVLPGQTRYEQRSGGTSTSTERRVRFTPEVRGPRIAEAKPEWEIPALIGQRLRPELPKLFRVTDTAEIRKEMAEVMPLYAGIDRLEREGDSLQWGGPVLGASGFVHMPNRRARFAVCKIPRIDVPEGRLLLTTRRGKQFNSMNSGLEDPLTRARRDAILLSPEDMQRLGLREGGPVRVTSDAGSMQAVAQVGPCREQHAQGFWPECNALLARSYDPASGEPEYSATVRIEPLA